MRRLRVALALAVAFAATACGGDTKPPESQSGLAANGLPPKRATPPPNTLTEATPTPARFDAASFHTTTDANVDAFLTADPVLATHLGDHRFDSRWPDTTKAGEEKVAADFRARAQMLRALAAKVPQEAVAAEAGTDRPALDAELLADELENHAFIATDLHVAERHPSHVLSLIGSGITSLTSHAFAPKRTRMDALATRLEGVPGLLATARSRLVKPEKSSLELLPVIAGGLVMTLRTDLAKTDPTSIDRDTKLAERLAKAALAAATAIDAYVADVTKTFPVASAKDEPIGTASWS
ncbi:MAG: hypothetical protein JWM74_1501, partial [Myxococcaceae bacterium]|nr:hypothetical protein [Myxococcaceae bacterium]